MKNLIYNILGGRRKSEDGRRKSEDGRRKSEDGSRKSEVACLPARQGSRENYLVRLAGNSFVRPAGLEALPAEQKPRSSKGFTRPVGLGGLPVERFLQTSRGFGRPVGVMTLPVGEFLQTSREFTRPVGQGSGKTEDGSRLPAGQAGKLEAGSRKSEARSTKREAGFSSLLNHCSNFLAPLSTLAKGDEIRPLVAGSEGVETPEQRKENKEHRIRKSEARSTKREAGFDNLLNHCSNFLAPLSPLAKGDEIRPLVAGLEGVVTPANVGKENKEHRSRKSEARSTKTEAGFDNLLNHCSNFLAPLSTLAKGDEIRPLVAGSEGVVAVANVGKENKEHRIANDEYRMMSDESERNIPVRCTFGFHALSGTTNIVGATHLGFQTAVTAIGETAAAPRNLCSIEYQPTGVKVRSTETLKENNEYRPRESSWTITNVESGSRKLEVKSKERNNMLHDTIIQQQRPETTNGQVETTPGIRKMTPGQVETAPGLKKMTPGRVKTAPGLKKMTHGRVKTAPGMRKTTQGRVETTPGRVEYASGPLPARHSAISHCALTALWYRVGTPERSEMVLIEGNNIPVLRTSGFHWNSSATNFNGALHLETQTAVTTIGETAGEPRNLCSILLNHRNNFLAPLSTLPKGDEIRFSGSEGVVAVATIEKENKEHRIRKYEVRSRKSEKISSEGVLTDNKQYSTTTITTITTTTPHKTLSRLPQESGFVSGDCPGAAAITINYSLFSSPRVSPIFAGFTQTNLPVKNRPETGGFLWYCHPAGRYSGQGTSTHPERPLQRTKPERRYAYVLN